MNFDELKARAAKYGFVLVSFRNPGAKRARLHYRIEQAYDDVILIRVMTTIPEVEAFLDGLDFYSPHGRGGLKNCKHERVERIPGSNKWTCMTTGCREGFMSMNDAQVLLLREELRSGPSS